MRIGERLVREGFVDAATVQRALADQRHAGRRLCSLLVARGQLDPDNAARALAEQHNCVAILGRHLDNRDPDLALLLPAPLARASVAVPLGRNRAGELIVCVRDPSPELRSALEHALGEVVVLGVCVAAAIEALVERSYDPSPHGEVDVDLTTGPIAMVGSTPGLGDLGALTLVELDDAGVTKDFSQSPMQTVRPSSPSLPPQARPGPARSPARPPVDHPEGAPPRQPSSPEQQPFRRRTPTPTPSTPTPIPRPPARPSQPPGAMAIPELLPASPTPSTPLPAPRPPAIRADKPVEVDPLLQPRRPASTAEKATQPYANPPPSLHVPAAPPEPPQPPTAPAPPHPNTIRRRLSQSPANQPTGAPTMPEPPSNPFDVPTARPIDTTLIALARASTPDGATEAAMRFLQARWAAALLFAIEDGVAHGHRGHGRLLPPEVISAIALPLTEPSIVQAAYAHRRIAIDDPPNASELHDRLVRLLGQPHTPAAAPITIAGEIACILVVGDPSVRGADEREIAQLANALGAAYTRILKA